MLKSRICFDDIDLILKVTAWLILPNLIQKELVCMLPREPLAGMLPTVHVHIIGAGSIAD